MEREAQLRYEKIKANLAKQISLGIGFMELREGLRYWEEDRRIMQDAREGRREDVNVNLPPVMEEAGNEAKESAISEKASSNLDDHDLAHNRSEPTNDPDGGTKARFRKNR